MENSHIQWTDHTFNPWIGCSKVSPGCAHCYAETLMDTRYGRVKWGKGNPRQRTSKAYWKQPLKWNREAAEELEEAVHDFGSDTYEPPARPRVFCASLADWLDNEVPIEWLADLLKLIHDTPNLDWLLLTKRPENWYGRVSLAGGEMAESWIDCIDMPERGVIPENVWIGTSVEDQKRADERIPELLKIPAKVRFLSCEPLLEEVNLGLTRLLPNPLIGGTNGGVSWVICGGESGHGARPMHPGWARYLRDQCQEAEVGFHFKQWGGVNKKATGRELDGRTWDELPDVQRTEGKVIQ